MISCMSLIWTFWFSILCICVRRQSSINCYVQYYWQRMMRCDNDCCDCSRWFTFDHTWHTYSASELTHTHTRARTLLKYIIAPFIERILYGKYAWLSKCLLPRRLNSIRTCLWRYLIFRRSSESWARENENMYSKCMTTACACSMFIDRLHKNLSAQTLGLRLLSMPTHYNTKLFINKW